MLKRLGKLSYVQLGFLQGLALYIYCGAVATIFWKGNEVFGQVTGYLGPVFVLVLLVVSVLACSLLAFAYPVYVFWDEKKTTFSLCIVFYTFVWLFVFALLTSIVLLLR